MLSSVLLLLPALACATHFPGLGLHNDNQAGLAINGIPSSDRVHWMRVANAAVREINGDPCALAPFGAVVVDTASNEVVCVAANGVGITGSMARSAQVMLICCRGADDCKDPTQHGEMVALDVCSKVLQERGLSPSEMLAAWKGFSLCEPKELKRP